MSLDRNGWEQLGWNSEEKLLIYGIGNVGRQDDGLGIRLVEILEGASLPSSVTLESNYQLNIEDALLISDYDVVLFVDASMEQSDLESFSIRGVYPSAHASFSTHEMSIEGVLALCEELYNKKPRTFLLALKGYEWGISEEMSQGARENLIHAARMFDA